MRCSSRVRAYSDNPDLGKFLVQIRCFNSRLRHPFQDICRQGS